MKIASLLEGICVTHGKAPLRFVGIGIVLRRWIISTRTQAIFPWLSLESTDHHLIQTIPMVGSPTSSTCAVKDGDDGTEERPAKRVR